MIENTQRQLGDAINDLNTEVKDTIAALRSKVNELAATMKVIMMALGKSLEEGGASKQKGKVRVLKPRSYAGEKNA